MNNINSRIALVVTDQETNAQIKNLGVGLLELRADLFKKLDPVYCLAQIKHRKNLKIPLLLTVRNQKNEGAFKTFSDEKKWQIVSSALPHVDIVDIELSSPLLRKVVSLAHEHHKRVIISSHFLQDTPKDLGLIFKRSLSLKADIVKIAAKAQSFDDVMTMLTFTRRHHQHPLITMSLGPLGAISRLILPGAGSMYSYAFLKKPTASGQVDVVTLKAHLKVYYPQ